MDKLDGGAQPDASSQELREYTKNFLREMKIANGDDPDVDLRKVKMPDSISQSQNSIILVRLNSLSLTRESMLMVVQARVFIFLQLPCFFRMAVKWKKSGPLVC